MASTVSIGDEAGFMAQQALGGVNRLSSLKGNAGQMTSLAKDQTILRQKSIEFESVFLSEMLKSMWKDVESDNLFGGGEAENTYRSLMIDEYGKAIAQHGGIGLAERVMQDLIKASEAKNLAKPQAARNP